MKVFLRILGYGGIGLAVLAHWLSYPWTSSLAALGAGLAIIAIVEAIVKYGNE